MTSPTSATLFYIGGWVYVASSLASFFVLCTVGYQGLAFIAKVAELIILMLTARLWFAIANHNRRRGW